MKINVIDRNSDFSFGRVASYHFETALFLIYSLSEKSLQVENHNYIENTALISVLYLIYQGTENYLKNVIFFLTVNNGSQHFAIQEGHNLHNLIIEVESRSKEFRTEDQCKTIEEYTSIIRKNISLFNIIHNDLCIVHDLIRFGTNIKRKYKGKPVLLSLTKHTNKKADIQKLYEKTLCLLGGLENLNNYVRSNMSSRRKMQ